MCLSREISVIGDGLDGRQPHTKGISKADAGVKTGIRRSEKKPSWLTSMNSVRSSSGVLTSICRYSTGPAIQSILVVTRHSLNSVPLSASLQTPRRISQGVM